ncbi:MAG: hypothetical protein ACE5JG_03400 [Planctomycetota bacterium]
MSRQHSRTSAFAIIEVLISGSFIAVAALGLSGALVSGVTLTDHAHRTMSRVATAENLMEQIRQSSQTSFNTLATDYDGTSVSANTSIGFDNDTYRLVDVRVPLDETKVPGSLDLDGNGLMKTVVNPADARVLVVDLAGSNSLRLRTAVFDVEKLTGLVLERGPDSNAPVGYGETRDPGGKANYTPPTYTPPPTPTDPQTQSTVDVASAGYNGKTAEVVLVNGSAGNRTPTTITIAPDKDNVFFEGIALDGVTLFNPPSDQAPGTVTIDLATDVSFAPGQATLAVGDFYKIKKGSPKTTKPKEVIVTVAFDDGSVVTTVVK